MTPPPPLSFINDFIDECGKTGSLCLSCPSFHYIKDQFEQAELNSELLERIAGSERHARCLCMMFANFNSVLSREKITMHVWGHINVSSASVPVLIFELRSMLQESNFEIINSRGKGYALIYRRGSQ